MMHHGDKVSEAFDTIHEEMRGLKRQNAELRARVNQKDAALQLMQEELSDRSRQVGQLCNQVAEFRRQLGRYTGLLPGLAAPYDTAAICDCEPADVAHLRAEGAL